MGDTYTSRLFTKNIITAAFLLVHSNRSDRFEFVVIITASLIRVHIVAQLSCYTENSLCTR